MGVSSDKDTLHLLSIFHYVLAGFIALVACIPLIHLAMGLFMIFGGVTEQEPGLGVVGGLFSLIAVAIILVGWGMAYLVFRAGRSIDRQENYQLCLVAGAVLCMFMPFGTILGVFSLVTLSNENVKKLFSEKAVSETVESREHL